MKSVRWITLNDVPFAGRYYFKIVLYDIDEDVADLVL